MPIDVDALFRLWKAASEIAGGLLDPITTEEQYTKAMGLLEVVWEAEKTRPELGSLLELLVEHIATYEKTTFPTEPTPAHRMLAFIMEQQAVSAQTLAQATGIEQTDLERLLSEEQDFTLGQVRALAQALHVNPEVFV